MKFTNEKKKKSILKPSALITKLYTMKPDTNNTSQTEKKYIYNYFAVIYTGNFRLHEKLCVRICVNIF